MSTVRPANNYFYKQQSREKFYLRDLFESVLRTNDPGQRVSLFACQLRRMFMVTAGEFDRPPFPEEMLAALRDFLSRSYREPHRSIVLTPAQMRDILRAIDTYRLYSADNRRIVLAHLDRNSPEFNAEAYDLHTPERELEILQNVLNLLPDAVPPQI